MRLARLDRRMAALHEQDAAASRRDRGVDDLPAAIRPPRSAVRGRQREERVAARAHRGRAGLVVIPALAPPEVAVGGVVLHRGTEQKRPHAANVAPIVGPVGPLARRGRQVGDHVARRPVDLPAAIADHGVDVRLVGAPVRRVAGHVEPRQSGNLQPPEDRAVGGIERRDPIETLHVEPAAHRQRRRLAATPVGLVAGARAADPQRSQFSRRADAAEGLAAIGRVVGRRVLVGP